MQIPASLIPAVALGGLWLMIVRGQQNRDPWIIGLMFGAMALTIIVILHAYVPVTLQMLLLPMTASESLIRRYGPELGLHFTPSDLSFSSVPYYGLLLGAVHSRSLPLFILLAVPLCITLFSIGVLQL